MNGSGAAATRRSLSSAEVPERLYFPELDSLRFIAFLMVYYFHGGISVPLMARLIGSRGAAALHDNGRFGVQLFFILSGYLIATHLLREEARFGRIDLRAFWVRRILRIWPLYYLVVAVGFGLIPVLDGPERTPDPGALLRNHLVPFLGFMGNWSMALLGSPPNWLSILWSVCVEEQFYVVAPLLIAWVVSRYRRPLVAVLIGGAIAVRSYCAHRYPSDHMIVFNTFAQLDTLLCGVMLALCLGWDRDRPRLARWLTWFQWPLYLAIGWLFSQPHLGHATTWQRTWDYVFVWLGGLGVVIVAVWGQGWLRTVLAYSRVVWLGKISYGLYMYHEIVIWMQARIYNNIPWFINKEELMTIATLALTIALAGVSYHFYERPFLQLKRAWTRVPSRPV